MLKSPVHRLLYGGIWALMGLYYTSWDMVAYHMPFTWALPLNMSQNAVWALEGLVIIRLAERFSIVSFAPRSLAPWIINLGGGLALALAGLAIARATSLGFEGAKDRALVLEQAALSLLRFTFTYLHSTLILMWGILGAFLGILLYKGMKAWERENVYMILPQ